ncbi:MAG: TlpA disulfide reductase family protein, partial [Chloroflexota bacterium]|nr:TlpA disulfide reductase family protein [Chloroflexota bacterium]
ILKIKESKMHKLNLRNISISITILFLILFFIFLTLGTLSEKAPKINRGVNSTMGEVIISAPEGTQFELKNLNGENINLEDYKGIPVVIDFWSSWCGPCIKEASVLSDGYKEWNFKGVEFIGIAIWDDKNSIENFIKNNDIQYEILIDKEGFTAVNFGVIAVPEKFFVRSDGTFAFKVNGPLDMNSLDEYISRLLEEDKK